MKQDDVDDQSLVKSYRRGDLASFDRLVVRHQDRLFRLARAWLSDETLASDATQEVFMRAMTGLRKFQFRAQPFSWLYQTLRNVCHEMNRGDSPQLYTERADSHPGPYESTALSHDTARMQALIQDLPERQREVLLLRVFEDLDVTTTANAMGCRPGTVKALLSQARQNLKALWP
ncbi:MAG: sigma-70 family RNA polymerase sigma factor [Pseudomonadota bacterium]